MATTWYVDFEGGNDANAGTSFATRKKTITAVTPVAGDSVRIMASTDPTSIGSATWNNLSKTVTIPSGLVASIHDGSTAWTASANVTTTASTTRKEGGNSASMAIAAAFTTGLVAYKTITLTDYSIYKQVSFWVRATAAVASGALEIRLCSDTVGAVTVNTIPVPQIANTAAWHPVTYDTTAALGASIQSVALFANTDPGTVTVLLDNIIACRDSTSSDSITLTTLIGKNTSGETFYGIQSIVGTTVLLDEDPNSQATVGQGYAGTTELVTTYIRKVSEIPFGTTADQLVVNTTGTAASPIDYSGGWNRTDMSTQTGESWVSGVHGQSNGLSFTNKSFITVSKLRCSRFGSGFTMAGTSNNNSFTDIVGNNCKANGFTTTVVTIGTITVSGHTGNNCGTTGMDVDGSYIILSSLVANNNGTTGVRCNMRQGLLTTVTCKNNGSQGVFFSSASETKIYNLITASNGTNGVTNTGNINYLVNASIAESSEVASASSFQNYIVRSHKHDNTTDNHMIFTDGGLISSETGADRRTASGMAWKFSPTSTNRSVTYPLMLDGIKIACAASTAVSVFIWVKRSNTALTARLFLRGGQINGAPSDVSASASGIANVYEQLTISFTPTEAGVVDVELQAYGGTTFNAWFDDMTISQV